MFGAETTVTSSSKFRRSHRLLSAGDFNRVFKDATKSSDRYFTILFCPVTGATARLGFAVAKKRIAQASARNRLKRIVRESFRKHRSMLPPVDIVVMANTRAGLATNRELFSSIEKHWERIGIRSNNGPGTAV